MGSELKITGAGEDGMWKSRRQVFERLLKFVDWANFTCLCISSIDRDDSSEPISSRIMVLLNVRPAQINVSWAYFSLQLHWMVWKQHISFMLTLHDTKNPLMLPQNKFNQQRYNGFITRKLSTLPSASWYVAWYTIESFNCFIITSFSNTGESLYWHPESQAQWT